MEDVEKTEKAESVEKVEKIEETDAEHTLRATRITAYATCAAAGCSLIAVIASLVTVYLFYKQTGAIQRQLEVYLSTTRPFLQITEFKNDQLFRVGYQAGNASNIPARIVYAAINSWSGKEPTKYAEDIQQAIIHTGQPFYIGIIRFEEPIAYETMIKKGKFNFEMKACVIYKSVSADDTRKWKATVHSSLNPVTGLFQSSSNEQEIAPDAERCEIGDLSPKSQ